MKEHFKGWQYALVCGAAIFLIRRRFKTKLAQTMRTVRVEQDKAWLDANNW